MLSASNGALGGLRSQKTWRRCSSTRNAGYLGAPLPKAGLHAAAAFDHAGALVQEAHRQRVQGVVEQVLGAASRLRTGDA